MYLLIFAIFTISVSASLDMRVGNTTRYCGWELMQNLHIPIPQLGDWYAEKTGDRSLCVRQDDGSEYCTCIYECGNGVWSNVEAGEDDARGYGMGKYGMWRWDEGCKKYCHAGVCDGQG